MPTTSKQKKARKSRETDMFSDIENFDMMLEEIILNKVILATLTEGPIVRVTTFQ